MHPIEENQQHVSSFFFITNLLKEKLKKSVALLIKEKKAKNECGMITLTFFELYTVYIKTNFIQRYLSSLKSYKYLNRFIS